MTPGLFMRTRLMEASPHPRWLPRQEPPGRNRPTVVALRYKVSDPPRSLRVLSQWTRGKEMEMIENCQNKADCSGVCRFQIRAYDKNMGDPVRPLMADESQKPLLLPTKRPSSTGESGSCRS